MRHFAIVFFVLFGILNTAFAQVPDLKHDYVFDVPEGNYKVTVTVGSRDRAAVTMLKAESLRLVIDNVATRKGEFKTLTFTVNKRDTLIYDDQGKVIDCIIPYYRDRYVPDWDSKLSFDIIGEQSAVESLVIEPVSDAITVFLCGDSTVTDQYDKVYSSWGQKLPLFFDEHVAVANYSYSGSSTSSFINCKKFKKVVGNLKQGDYVFIEFGHNDEKDRGAGAGAKYNYAHNLKTMIDQVRQKGAVPVLLTPTQRRNFDSEGKVHDTHKGYAEAMKEVADRENVICIDLTAMTQKMIQEAGPEESWKYFVQGDGTHNNNFGAYEISKLVVRAIIDKNIPLKQYIRNYPEEKNSNVVTAPEAPFTFEPLVMFNFPQKDFNIARYGARKDDAKATSAAFAKAMEACNKAGGGRVVVPAGEWLTGPVHFRSNCNLYLDEGAVLVFDDDPQLYLPAVRTSWEGSECLNYSPLVYAFECENVGISGPGRLAPRMDFWKTWFARPETHIQATRRLYAMCSTGIPVKDRHMEENDANMRPHLIQFNRCTNVNLDGFEIRESPFWTIHLYMCKDVWAHNLNVYAHGHNNDGIDIEMTQHALVENCTFDQGDDAVVIKSGRNQDAWRLATPTQDVVIRNCNVVQGHCLMGIGSEMAGGVRRVYMHDCQCSDQVYRLFYLKTNHRRGGFIEDVTMENVSAPKMQRVFEIDTDVLYQWRDIVPTFETAVTRIRNITIRGVRADQTDAIYDLKGDERDPIQGVTIENIHVGEVHKFLNNAVNVKNLQVSNVSWDNFGGGETSTQISGFAPGN